MDGLDTYYGDPVSAHADRQLELEGIGRLFAMSRRPALNTLAVVKFRREFGRNRVFTLRNAQEKDDSEKRRVAENFRAPRRACLETASRYRSCPVSSPRAPK